MTFVYKLLHYITILYYINDYSYFYSFKMSIKILQCI